MRVDIGEVMPPAGWNTAKRLGAEHWSGAVMKVEAQGVDWIVFRSVCGTPFAEDFNNAADKARFLETFER